MPRNIHRVKLSCPQCGGTKQSVKNSRGRADNLSVWRRRKCEVCGHTFTTTETAVSEERAERDILALIRLTVPSETTHSDLKEILVERLGKIQIIHLLG